MYAAATITAGAVILSACAILACYFYIKWRASPYLFDDPARIPFRETALVLGTAKFTSRGGVNLFFSYRVEAAGRLFAAGKASTFIMSGADKDGRRPAQADEMKMAMTAMGAAASRIISDDKSYRTWDSLWRCRYTYHRRVITVVSQRFHTERAVFIARRMGMDATGFNARQVKGKTALRMFIRECAARVKCILDCYILRPVPVYLKRRRRFFW
jgi:SanA protein